MNYTKYLTEDILPFWLNNAIDKEKGGIFYSLDKCGKVTCEQKNLWFTGRALWSFATAYNTIEPKEEYLNTCQNLYTFIKNCVLPNGRLPFLTDREGNVIKESELFHGEVHAAMGCAAYYKACKDENVKIDAIKYFDLAYHMYKSGKARKERTADNKERYIFGRDMLVLSLAQVMRSSGIEDARIEELADESVKNIAQCGYIDDKLQKVREYASCESSLSEEIKNTYSCIGHLYEAAWFILCEGEVKNSNSIRELGKKILDYALTHEENKAPKAVRTDTNSSYDEYIWWPQCEAIIAYYLAYNIFGHDAYLRNAKSIEDFAFKSFADTKNGEWYAKCSKTGQVLDHGKGSLIKGVFHLPRMLMVLAAIEEKNNIFNYIQ